MTAVPEPAPEAEVEEAPPAELETRSGDAVFIAAFVDYFGTTPDDEVLLTARDNADLTSELYAQTGNMDEIVWAFLSGCQEGGGSMEDCVFLFAVSVVAYGTPETVQALENWVAMNS